MKGNKRSMKSSTNKIEPKPLMITNCTKLFFPLFFVYEKLFLSYTFFLN